MDGCDWVAVGADNSWGSILGLSLAVVLSVFVDLFFGMTLSMSPWKTIPVSKALPLLGAGSLISVVKVTFLLFLVVVCNICKQLQV